MSRTLALFAGFILWAAPGFSGTLQFVLNPAVEAGVPGGDVFFGGTLKNLGPPDLFLNDYEITFTPPAGTYLADDHNFFFFNVNGVLLSGESYAGPIFHLTLAPGTPGGNYFGSITILGGDTPDAFDAIGTQSFEVSVAPEPSTVGLLLAGLAMGWRRRRSFGCNRLSAGPSQS